MAASDLPHARSGPKTKLTRSDIERLFRLLDVEMALSALTGRLELAGGAYNVIQADGSVLELPAMSNDVGVD